MAPLSTIEGCYCPDDHMDASASERAQLCEVPSEERPGRRRAMRKFLGPRRRPIPKKLAAFQKAAVYAAAKNDKALRSSRESAQFVFGSFTRWAGGFPTSHASRDAQASRSSLGAIRPYPSANRGS